MAPAKRTSAAKMASVTLKSNSLIVVENVHPIIWYYTRQVVIPSPNLQLASSGKPNFYTYYPMLRNFDKSHRTPDYVACVRQSVQPTNTCSAQEFGLRTGDLIEPSLFSSADSFIASTKIKDSSMFRPEKMR